MKKISILNAIIFGLAGISIIAAVILFASYRSGGDSRNSSPVVVWGTIDGNVVSDIKTNLISEDDSYENLQYIQKNSDSFDDDLLRALAEGTGPDLVILNEKQIMANQNRMITIPYDSFALRTYQDMFIDESNLLLTRDGILGFPFLIDPIVMYYNKNIMNNNGYARPPENWTELLAITPTITQKDTSFNISKSAIALGSFNNVKNAKDIFWMLTLQAGNPVIERFVDTQDQIEKYQSLFISNLNYSLMPTYASTNFFTQFSNPTKTIYTWNKSLPDSQTAFISGDLAFYLGLASELPVIKRLNPNLNFDVAMVPQSQNSNRKATYGSMSIFVIPKTSKNPQGAMAMIAKLTSRDIQKMFTDALGVPSVRRDLLSSADSQSSYQSVFNKSAIISQGVLEPSPQQMTSILKELIDTVVSGEYEVSSALSRAQDKITLLLKK